MPAKLRVTLVKSPISHTQRTRGTMLALGLHRIGQSVVVADTPELRGMARAIQFLVRTEPFDESAAAGTTAKPVASAKPAPSKPGPSKPGPRKKEASKS